MLEKTSEISCFSLISDDGIIIYQDMYKVRILTSRLKELMSSFPVVVVLGARQVGKSTLIQHVFSDYDYTVFDPVIDIGNARSEPDLFLDNHPAPAVFDEIQYAPELVSSIKRRVDQQSRPGLYVLTGSQQWQVIRSIAESLAGRAVFINLDGFCLSEITQQPITDHWLNDWLTNHDAFLQNFPDRLNIKRTLYEQLWRGWLPEADRLNIDLIPDLYGSYLQTYIERDIRLLTDISDWQQFGRFVQLAAALTAQEINISQFGRDIGVTPQTARRWLAMLSATFQWFELPAYHGNTIKRISGKPKGYMTDTGLACNLQMISSPKALGGHPLLGAIFETAVIAEIRKRCSTLATPPKMYHWRSHSGAEVDLVLERDGCFFPIEIKLTSHPAKKDAKGLQTFRDTYPALNIAAGLVIAPTERCLKISEHDYAIPWDLC